VRLVELHPERVVLRRAVRGIKMTVQLPVAAYLGVAIRLVPPDAGSTAPSQSCSSIRDIVAEWQS
jgi:hypothetical protein